MAASPGSSRAQRNLKHDGCACNPHVYLLEGAAEGSGGGVQGALQAGRLDVPAGGSESGPRVTHNCLPVDITRLVFVSHDSQGGLHSF